MDIAVKVAKFTIMQYTQVDKGLLEHSSAVCFTVEPGNIHLVGILELDISELNFLIFIQNHFVRLAFLWLLTLLSV